MISMDPFRAAARDRDIPEDEIERWLTTVRPCATLDPEHEAAPDGTVAGRIGGPPPLPEGEPEPDPPFLALVDLAAIPPGATDLPLPADGMLLFFADTEEPSHGDEWHRLVYVPAGTPVSERGPGGEGAPEVFPARYLHVAVEPSLPNRGSYSEEFPHGGELGEVWWNNYDKMQKGDTIQLGGYPWVWNTDPLENRGPGDWVMLADISGEDLIEHDLGRVTWVIRREDLVAGRFDRVEACFDNI